MLLNNVMPNIHPDECKAHRTVQRRLTGMEFLLILLSSSFHEKLHNN